MARIRTVKPGFWTHEDLSELPPEVHMLAAALLCYADDEGYFNANPKLVKAGCLPLREDSVSTHGALKQLEKVGFIEVRTGTDGKVYGRICKFVEHQRINRPTPSKIKALWPLTEDSVSPHNKSSEHSHPEEEGKGRERNTPSERPQKSGASDPSEIPIPAGHSEAEVYQYGKAVLGKNAGGMITKLVRHWEGDLLAAKDTLMQASTKGNPREWLAAVLNHFEEPRTPDHILFPPELYGNIRA